MRSRRHWPKRALGVTVGLAIATPLAQAQDDPGRAQFLKSCGTCHAIEAEAAPRQGPNLLGVFGRKAGALEGFKYSDALKSADWVWDEEHLDKGSKTPRPCGRASSCPIDRPIRQARQGR